MQFVENGPDIPDALLQAHEEGRVVFFCGAGISYPAGLPLFKGLVERVYKKLGEVPKPGEELSSKNNQFDATLNQLEQRVVGDRIAIRKAVAEILQPDLSLSGATASHEALLTLARTHKGTLRLVTTNFDHVFEAAAQRIKDTLPAFAAPFLPAPKNSRWDGLVYLHGRLPSEKDDENDLNRLVLTSGDFGQAYLTERWAARFVSELFRNYVVCFVGYSINDPVMRYMMDALAADRRLGDARLEAFAFGDYEPGQKDVQANEWRAKGVIPILYQTYSSSQNHSALHNTLKIWAETYRDGILGKESIVVSNAMTHPSCSTQQDDFVGRMIWALSDESGLPAKCFANHDPLPSLDWLAYLAEARYQLDDLPRFGIQPPINRVDLEFSLLNRPTPHTLAPRMSLHAESNQNTGWDRVMLQLGRWLVRHLDNPDLILWLSKQSAPLHPQLLRLIENQLFEQAQKAQNETESRSLSADGVSPDAPAISHWLYMQTLWRLFLTGCVKSGQQKRDLYSWKDRVERYGLKASLRFELRELLAPKVILKKPRWPKTSLPANTPLHPKQLINWELVLASDNPCDIFEGNRSERIRETLPHLQSEFEQLLRDTLDLFSELGKADERNDPSSWHLPSVSLHWQNDSLSDLSDWGLLIRLLRDAWLVIREQEPARATRIALNWFEQPYLTFKRLALFAASHDNCIASETWLDWLLRDKASCLWSLPTQREAMRLLVLQGKQLSPKACDRLEAAIIAGEPDHDEESKQQSKDWVVWLRLAKLQERGRTLGDAGIKRFNELSATYPLWALSKHEREEFSSWSSGTGDPDYEEHHRIDVAPKNKQVLIVWLQSPQPERRAFDEDTWSETCRSHPLLCISALRHLGKQKIWPSARWEQALSVWSEDNSAQLSWKYAVRLIHALPDHLLQDNIHSFSSWAKAVSKSVDSHEAAFLNLCRRVLELTPADKLDDQPRLTAALSHPVGHITQALLNLWFKRKPNDNDGLPADIAPLFSQLCNTSISRFRHGRIHLASQLISLYRVDSQWTETNLLPLFDWGNSPCEASAVWQGFLRSPRLNQSLLNAIKSDFLDTAHHFDQLEELSRQYAGFLTYTALEGVDGFDTQDFHTAFAALPQSGLDMAAKSLYQFVKGAGNQRPEYWKNRVQPFWQHIWPKSSDCVSGSIRTSLAQICVVVDDEFPEALSVFNRWFGPLDRPEYILKILSESKLPASYPTETLAFMDSIVANPHWLPAGYKTCLDVLAEASPTLMKDRIYQRLLELWRKSKR